jgi:hypothetical protein
MLTNWSNLDNEFEKHVNFEGPERASLWVGMQSYQWQKMDVIKLFASNYYSWDHYIFFSNYTKLVMTLNAYKVQSQEE